VRRALEACTPIGSSTGFRRGGVTVASEGDLSTGQKQLLSFARALPSTPILVLDERRRASTPKPSC